MSVKISVIIEKFKTQESGHLKKWQLGRIGVRKS